ncbi:uncharacterized protein A4U43_C06F12630 [Asparagus officinalis]|uniref:Uncharacterized protein n=1 Tax=Asparagus officinalis TaxID=4686 RepID=A0A5P1ELG9_ASPOF|nr:uncharacterized protein A4U43_C06F12630 [Asparagus officinalis]
MRAVGDERTTWWREFMAHKRFDWVLKALEELPESLSLNGISYNILIKSNCAKGCHAYCSIAGVGLVSYGFTLIFYFPLDLIKFAVQYGLSGEAWNLRPPII